MNARPKLPKTLAAIVLIGTLIALYLSNTQYNYALSVALILIVLLVLISRIMAVHKGSGQPTSTALNSRFAVTLLIALCAFISIYLVKVSSEPIFSQSTQPNEAQAFAKLSPLQLQSAFALQGVD